MPRDFDRIDAYLHLLIMFISFSQSNYGAGLRILHVDTEDLDVHEVAYFDVLPTSQPRPAFEGTWSNYPYFASGQNNKIEHEKNTHAL